MLLTSWDVLADATGDKTGGIANVPSKVAGKPTLEEIGAALGQTRVSLNFVWTLVAGFLVMFMQAGFALAETGFTRAKNAAHTMTMNFMVYGLGILGFWVAGFALQMGGSGSPIGSAVSAPEGMSKLIGPVISGNTWGLFGGSGFFLTGSRTTWPRSASPVPDGLHGHGAHDPDGSDGGALEASRICDLRLRRLGDHLPDLRRVGLGRRLAVHPRQVRRARPRVLRLRRLGRVHLTGGVMALTGAYVLGPRIGKYVKGHAQAIPGHNLPMAVLGCFILAFGWFGFNAGSTLSGTDLRIAVVATNTMLASASGALFAYLTTWKKFKRPDLSMAVNGMLAGLVAITAPCAFVTAPSAVLIGAVAGVLVVLAALFSENRLKIDDPVGAIAVHGVNGAWGLIALGLLADGTYGGGLNSGPAAGVAGLLYGDPRQLVAQFVGIGANLLWVGGASFALFKGSRRHHRHAREAGVRDAGPGLQRGLGSRLPRRGLPGPLPGLRQRARQGRVARSRGEQHAPARRRQVRGATIR